MNLSYDFPSSILIIDGGKSCVKVMTETVEINIFSSDEFKFCFKRSIIIDRLLKIKL